jgi:hypothetical protein
MSENEERGEIAFDLQTGLGRLDVPEYDALRIVGMAAVLAIHLKGLDEIAYDVLRKVSDHYFDIPSYALKSVLEVLAETELVKLVTEGKTIKKVIPTVPFFSNVYSLVGEYSRNEGVNEHEALVLKILGKLKDRPYNQDSLRTTLGADANMMKRAIDITQQGKILRTHRARGQNIIVSPLYFADGLEALADMAAARGLSELDSLLNKIKAGQGWPLDLILSNSSIAGTAISEEEKRLLNKLTQENVLKPPSLSAAGKHYNFVFTPKAPLQTDSSVGLRRAIARMSEVKGELDPGKRAHLYLLCEAVAAISIYLFDFLSRIVRLIGADFKENDFEQLAKLMIWGGVESYEEKIKIRQLALPYGSENELELPAWKEFLRLASTLLVAVNQISSLPLVMRNLAFRTAGEIRAESEEYTRFSLAQPRSRQMIFAIVRYVVAATEIPKDFVNAIEATVNSLIEEPPSPKVSRLL